MKTQEQIRKWIEEAVDELAAQIEAGEVDPDLISEAISKTVDNGWAYNLCITGYIPGLPNAPDDMGAFQSVGNILAVAESMGAVETNSGLWEGLRPWPAIASQAFFSLEGCIWSGLYDRGLI